MASLDSILRTTTGSLDGSPLHSLTKPYTDQTTTKKAAKQRTKIGKGTTSIHSPEIRLPPAQWTYLINKFNPFNDYERNQSIIPPYSLKLVFKNIDNWISDTQASNYTVEKKLEAAIYIKRFLLSEHKNTFSLQDPVSPLNLRSLPEKIFEIGFESTTRVLLDGNKFTSIPESIGDLQNLIILILGDMPLTSLPSSFSKLKNLEYFDLLENLKKEIPEAFRNIPFLKTLGLYEGFLENLPPHLLNNFLFKKEEETVDLEVIINSIKAFTMKHYPLMTIQQAAEFDQKLSNEDPKLIRSISLEVTILILEDKFKNPQIPYPKFITANKGILDLINEIQEKYNSLSSDSKKDITNYSICDIEFNDENIAEFFAKAKIFSDHLRTENWHFRHALTSIIKRN